MAPIKGIKKKFFEVKLPITATKIHIYGSSPQAIEGNIIKLDMSKSLRGKNVELRAKIINKNSELEAYPISLEVMQSFIRRAIRSGTDYVEDSFEVICKDAKLRIKPFLLTRKRVSRPVLRELRNQARKFIEAYVTVRTIEEIFSELTTNKIQRELSLKLKKIYPLAFCEIRKVEIVPEKKIQSAS
jgi:ribosomal protein S3AE